MTPAQVFNEDITGPEGSAVEVFTATNGSFDDPYGNFTLRYGANDTTWSLPLDATADEVEEALEVRERSLDGINPQRNVNREHRKAFVSADQCVGLGADKNDKVYHRVGHLHVLAWFHPNEDIPKANVQSTELLSKLQNTAAKLRAVYFTLSRGNVRNDDERQTAALASTEQGYRPFPVQPNGEIVFLSSSRLCRKRHQHLTKCLHARVFC